MNGPIYEITEINRRTGKREADSMRIGQRYYRYILAVGRSAILPLVDNEEKALMTSRVTEITEKGSTVRFSTENSDYVMEAVK